MTNSFLNDLKRDTNFTTTENGAVTHISTLNPVLDLFAMGGAYRNRSDEDCITLFKSALEADEKYALKCLFYLRDIRGGQGERRFFRTCMKWLANEKTNVAKRNLRLIPEFGRWDDLYLFVETPLEKEALNFMKEQFALDLMSLENPNGGVSLLGKWLKSCNASSKETKRLGNITRLAFGMTQKEYRKTLAELRERINIVEKLMSENRWDEIEFDKIPSKAGLIYKNAFARRDIIAEKYEKFAKDKNTTVNAKDLYPYEVVHEVTKHFNWYGNSYLSKTDRAMINKYWDNLQNWFDGQSLNALAVIDTSGSMTGTPIEVAISLGIYCAERAGGPFANHYISFASKPQLIKVEGVDFVDKVERIYKTNLIDNTNLEAIFNLLLKTAIKNKTPQEELPENILIISDMQIDQARGYGYRYNGDTTSVFTEMENIHKQWENAGYKMPKLIYWNVDARDNTILDASDNISYVSGMSPSIFKAILSGKTQIDLMFEVLNSSRYKAIY